MQRTSVGDISTCRKYVVRCLGSSLVFYQYWSLPGYRSTSRLKKDSNAEKIQTSGGHYVDYTHHLWCFTHDNQQESNVLFHGHRCCCLLRDDCYLLYLDRHKSLEPQNGNSSRISSPSRSRKSEYVTLGWASRDCHGSHCGGGFHYLLGSFNVPSLCICWEQCRCGLQLGQDSSLEQFGNEPVDLLLSDGGVSCLLQEAVEMWRESQKPWPAKWPAWVKQTAIKWLKLSTQIQKTLCKTCSKDVYSLECYLFGKLQYKAQAPQSTSEKWNRGVTQKNRSTWTNQCKGAVFWPHESDKSDRRTYYEEKIFLVCSGCLISNGHRCGFPCTAVCSSSEFEY